MTISIDIIDAVQDKDAEVVNGACARDGNVELTVRETVVLEVDADAAQRLPL